MSWEEAKERKRLADFVSQIRAIVRGIVQCSFSRKRSNFRHFWQSKFTAGSGLVFNELRRSSHE